MKIALWKRALGLAVIATLGALAMSAAAQDEETVLVIGHAESTDSLDPARGYTQTTGIINHVTYDTLVTFPQADASEILPSLATEWTISDDGLTYTFTLRDDVLFADGDPLTGDDVVFSVNRLSAVQGSPSFLTANIADVVAEGNTVTFTLTAPDPAFLARLANNAFGVSNADVVQANGGTDADDAATTDTAEEYLNSTSAGSGPYVLEGWTPLEETVLVRNENYWGEAPYFDRIIITNLPEAATQAVSVESGEIDVALDVTIDQTAGLESNGDITIYSSPSNIVHFILMNRNEEIGGPVSDPRVAEAIRYALDYPGYVELWGGVTPATTMAYGLFGAYGPEQALTRDLDRARELLAEAGYADGFDITLEYPTFTFQGVNMDTNAQKIQADLAEIGINVTLSPGDLGTQLEGYRAGTQGFAYWFWGPDVLDPVDQLAFLPGGKVADERTNWEVEGADQEILDLVEQATTESDPDARAEIFAAIQDYMQVNGPYAAFIQPDVQIAARAGIEGIQWHPQWLIDVALISATE